MFITWSFRTGGFCLLAVTVSVEAFPVFSFLLASLSFPLVPSFVICSCTVEGAVSAPSRSFENVTSALFCSCSSVWLCSDSVSSSPISDGSFTRFLNLNSSGETAIETEVSSEVPSTVR